MKRFKLLLALAAAMSLLVSIAPATAHTTSWWTCNTPSPSTAGDEADTDCTAHLHWAAKTDWLKVELPIDAVLAVSGPVTGDKVGESIVATNFVSDFDCSTSDDLQDGGTYDILWQGTWTSYSAPPGWTKVAEYKTVVQFVDIPTHVIKNDTTDQYATVTDLPTTLTCSGTPTDMNVLMFSHVDNDPSKAWVGRNPTTAGCHDVTATATLTTGVAHSDDDTISIGGALC